jgi:integrase
MRLTDMSVKALKAPLKGVIYYTDDTLTGFGVRVSQAGTKSYVLTHGARRERETIGRVGVVGLSDARSEAKRRLAEYTLGKTRLQSINWNVAAEQYLAEVKAKRKPRTHADYKGLLDRHFRFGDTKLSELSARDFLRKLDKLAHTPAEQQHAFVILRAFIRWSYRRHYLDTNPMDRMMAPHRYKPRERILTNEELGCVWNAAMQMDTFGAIVRLLILTGQRVGEITHLAPDMVGAGVVTLPASLTKNSREHTFPISSLAEQLLSAAPGTKSFLFPARGSDGERAFNGFSKSKARLDALADVHGWTLHDLRRTFASGLASLGVTLPVVERLLNHVSGSFAGIVGVYQRYDFMPEMREAAVKWEANIQKLTEGHPSASLIKSARIRDVSVT